MVDYRNPVQRPRTRMDQDDQRQPIGRSGLDPLQQQPMDPLRTFETPIVSFPADIAIPNNFNGPIQLPQRCVQIAFISLIPNVVASFNGGGSRTIKDGFVMNGLFNSLDVATDAGGSCIIQLGCY